MKSIKAEDGMWWVIECGDCEPIGPYQTKADAEETRKGLQRTLDNQDDHSFFTCD